MVSYSFCSTATLEELLCTPLSSQIPKINKFKKNPKTNKTHHKLKILRTFQAINLLLSEFLLPYPIEHMEGLTCPCTDHTRHAVKASGSGEQKHGPEYNISKDFLLRAPIPAPATRQTDHHRTTLAISLWTWGKATEQPSLLRFIIFNEPAEVG